MGWWPVSWGGLAQDLTFLEFFLILVAVYLWHDTFANRKVLFWCDNQAVVRIVNKQLSCSEQVMRLVRKFVLLCLCNNI